ncbi:serine/threonine protein kinase [Neorhodopirellula pilleata]|uniref:Serine/threonine-protein kinase StkP n=1 Tax=Neorhodopirellula pilleata TaxID=2714738 RepID=A0A5C6ABA5_9BACT|nr:protein kinase [Neorhodopirellula pilleata]TWT96331.1 Serine/threonine-protein kinase StkP [Neorhodopirellula pilleata]
MAHERHANCGQSNFKQCLLTCLMTASESRLEDADRCEVCQVTCEQLDQEIRRVGAQLASARAEEHDADVNVAIDRNLTATSMSNGISVGAATNSELRPFTFPEINGYQLRQLLGDDGSKAIYLATHHRLQKDVAVCILPERLIGDPVTAFRFDLDIKKLAALEHPSLATVLDVGFVNGDRFVVTEWVDGVDLETLIQDFPLEVPDVCEIGRQVACVMAEAHQQSLIHGRLHAANIVLTSDPLGCPLIRILDLGLIPCPIGVDERTDIISLGHFLAYALTGSVPDLQGEVKWEAEALDVPSDLSDHIERMMTGSPGRCPASMAEVAESLAPFARGHDLRRIQLSHAPKVRRSLTKKTPAISFVDQPVTERTAEGINEVPRAQAFAEAGQINRMIGVFIGIVLFLSIGLVIAGATLWSYTDGGYVSIKPDTSILGTPVSGVLTVLRDGERVESVELNATTLAVPRWYRAGEFEVSFEFTGSPTSQVDWEPKRFILRRGKNAVISLRQSIEE